MLKQILARAMRRHYHWRTAAFTELSELYVSSMLHTLGISVLMVFVPFYLYEQGYGVPQIFMVYGCFFITRVLADFGAAFLVARVGPKHTLIVSCLLQIASAALFISVPAQQWPVWLLGSVWGASASFFFIAFHVAFSKVKHTAHAGKELGYLMLLDKTGAVLGPLLGGIAGSYLGPHYIFIIASLVLLASLVPLFRTSEPVKTRQKLRFGSFDVARIKHDLMSYASLGVENSLCINVWPFYVALFVLSGTVYAQLGVLTASAVVVSMAAAYGIGHLADRGRSRQLLRLGALCNALLYAVRPFIGSFGGVLAVNTANELVTTAYRLPFIKGMYAAADSFPGFRIVYITSLESFGNLCKAMAWILLAIVATAVSARSVLYLAFFIAAAASLLILTERFKALTPNAYNRS